MPGPGEVPAQPPVRIIGREGGLARLRGLVDPVPEAGQVLVVIGEAGMGKTVLLADTAGRARSAGMRVLPVTGRESESKLAFAGLHQLLRPVLPSAAGLPGRQAQALLGALGLTADRVAPDPLLTGVAVLTLLSDLSGRSPVLVVADDAHWLDRSTLDTLAFAGTRLDVDRVVLLLGARGQAPPPGFDRGFPELHLEPLSTADASRLLDGQPRPPQGRARAQVLAQAAGNPMALIELAKVIAADPAASRRWAAEPLPLTDRLSAVITARFAALPGPAQAALLLAAVADGPELSAAASRGGGPDAQAFAPAEQAGLVTIDRAGLQFSHPLVRSAIYHSAPFAQRAAAHRQLAGALHDQPDRRAWHLAAAALNPDEHVASLLEATAAQAQQRGGAAAAALALERAAELSPDPAGQARRLVAAASAAVPTGQADWVQELATRALAVTRIQNCSWPPATTPDGHSPTPASAQPRCQCSSPSPKRHRLTGRPSPGRPSRMRPPSPTSQVRPPAARPWAACSNSWNTKGRRPAMRRALMSARGASGYGPVSTRPAAETRSSRTCTASRVLIWTSRLCGEPGPPPGSWTNRTWRSICCRTPCAGSGHRGCGAPAPRA